MEADNRDEARRLGTMADDPHSHHYLTTQLQHQAHLDSFSDHLSRSELHRLPDPEYHSPYPGPSSILPHLQTTSTTAAQSDQHPHMLRTYADLNSRALTANNLHVDDDGVDPDDFYRSYQSVDPASSLASPQAETETSMATTTTSGPRDKLSPPLNPGYPSRSHPSNASSRSSLRHNLRSASAPIGNDRPSVNPSRAGSAGKPSVKDLTKKFDQDTSSMIPRPPARSSLIHRPTYASRSKTSTSSNGPGHRVNTTAKPTPSSRAPSSSSHSSSTNLTRPSPRSKGPGEDKPSSSGQSFANRVNKPRPAGNAPASKPMDRLSHSRSASQSSPAPTKPSTDHSSQPILFGEILPEQRDTHTLGYGIQETLPRVEPDTSEPVLDATDAPPESPTDWYRAESLPRKAESPSRSPPTPTASNQGCEDLTTVPASPSHRPMSIPRPSKTAGSNSSPYRGPTSAQKSHNTSRNSAHSTSNLPFPTFRRPQTNGRSSRAGTPTGTRSKTPTESQAGRKGPPRKIITSGNSTSSNRLNAFISTPPPKLSPPLRSSRPRQPVSVATTASSRSKAVEQRPKSPERQPGRSRRSPSVSDEKSTRRKKVSVGNIDFEQRREHVKLAYRKSIRQSRIQEAKQRLARNTSSIDETNLGAESTATADQPAIILNVVEPEAPPPTSDADGPDGPTETQQSPPMDLPDEVVVAAALDSPTLGMPGSFPTLSPPIQPDEIEPQSAISATSDMTEFDNEPQADLTTQPPLAPAVEMESRVDIGTTEDLTADPPPIPQTGYHYPFDEEDEESTHSPEQIVVAIGLDIADAPTQPESIPVAGEFEEGGIPGAFGDDYVVTPYAPDSYETRVRILRRESDLSQCTESPTSHAPFPAYDYGPRQDYTLSAAGEDAIEATHGQEDGSFGDNCSDDNGDSENNELYFAPGAYHSEIGDSNRASTCESLDAAYHDASLGGSFDIPSNTDSPRMLGVPTMLMSGNRSSQHSNWTDFSIDSSEPSDGPRAQSSRSRLDQLDPSPAPEQESMFSTSSPGPEERVLPIQTQRYHDPDLASLGDANQIRDSYASSHQLPELDTGDGFSVPYLGKKPLEQEDGPALAPCPSHEAPPVPDAFARASSEVHHTPSNSIYETHSSTLFDPQRDSDGITLTSTPPSTHQVEVEVTEQVLHEKSVVTIVGEPISDGVVEKAEPPSKEKQRLVQRRNVLKELVDTEGVFVRDMNIVEEIYKGTAEACPKLDGKTVKLIFRNTDEIITFHTSFLSQLKEAVAPVYQLAGRKSPPPSEDSRASQATTLSSGSNSGEPDDEKDRLTSIGPVFKANIDAMKAAHEGFLRTSDLAAKRLIQIQQDRTVKVWLNECNEVAKDLTAAWDLDSLLIKPMQRITKYPNLIITLLQHTPEDHPDRPHLLAAKESLETAIIEINKTKKNFELVGQIVGRKRKESDVKSGLARAFGKRVDKLQTPNNRTPEDKVYAKLRERFGDDYLRLQVVLRDVEFYTRQVAAYVHEFLQYLSSIELVMRLQASPYPEMESKWVQFNVSMRDIEKVALEQHLTRVRKDVIEPFELVIKAYGNPSTAMKKRAKRRLDFEKAEHVKKSGKALDSKLKEQVEQYEALNDTLKKELPKLSELTVKVGNICLGNLVNLQASWYAMWRDKVKVVLEDAPQQPMPEIQDIISAFQRDYQYPLEAASTIGIINPSQRRRASQSQTTSMVSVDEGGPKPRPRPTELSLRSRVSSVNGEGPPSIPTPEFAGRSSETFTLSPSSMTAPSPHHYYYRDYYAGINGYRAGGASPHNPDAGAASRLYTVAGAAGAGRPSTGRSIDSSGAPRQSSESSNANRNSNSTLSYSVGYGGGGGGVAEPHTRFSGIFHSALPMPDETEESLRSQRSSRASSRERGPANNGYNVLWLAASLFEFNIETTKHEAGYPYLIYQAGEIFDVIAEKGELWLAKNQDDAREQVGWIWSKHFAKLADS